MLFCQAFFPITFCDRRRMWVICANCDNVLKQANKHWRMRVVCRTVVVVAWFSVKLVYLLCRSNCELIYSILYNKHYYCYFVARSIGSDQLAEMCQIWIEVDSNVQIGKHKQWDDLKMLNLYDDGSLYVCRWTEFNNPSTETM